MKSNICRIEKGTLALEAILKESEKVAVYNELTDGQASQLRLLCEEVNGMLPNIIGEFCGDFWIDFNDGVCKINILVKFEDFTSTKKKELIEIAKDKKNFASKGIWGKIRSALEDIFLDVDSYNAPNLVRPFNCLNDYALSNDYDYTWSLQNYKQVNKTEDKEWDELEKSIITSLADDVIVGVKGKTASIIIIKNFV